MAYPGWLTDERIVERDVFEWGDKTYSVFVLRADVEPDLQDFVAFIEQHGDDESFLIISEDVPEQYRLPVLGPEVIEFTELAGERDRCRKATERELEPDLVPADQLDAYIVWRIEVFAALIDYKQKAADEAEANGKNELYKQFMRTLVDARSSYAYLLSRQVI
jgi:hypothetical protein